MKYTLNALLLSILLLLHLSAQAQQDKPNSIHEAPFPSFTSGKFIASIAIGVPNIQMRSFPLPAKIESGGLSGHSPAYAKVEYGLTDKLGLVATLLFNQYYAQYETGKDSGGFYVLTQRYAGAISLYSGGLSFNYHFKKLIHNYHFDPYLQAGCWAGLEYHFNQEDSYRSFSKTLVKPRLSAGLRYYVDRNIGLNVEAGYDWASIVTLGFSYRFLYSH